MDKASPVYVVDQQHRHGRMRLSLDRLFFRHSSYADVPVNADAVQVLGRPSRTSEIWRVGQRSVA